MDNSKWNKFKEHDTATLTDTELQGIREELEPKRQKPLPSFLDASALEPSEEAEEAAMAKESAKAHPVKREDDTLANMYHEIMEEQAESADQEVYEVPEPTISNEDLEAIFTESYAPRPLTPDDVNYNVIMERFTSAPTKPKFHFEEFGDYWTCSCGQINQGETCINCGLERSLLRSLFFLHKPDEEGIPYDVPYVPYGADVASAGKEHALSSDSSTDNAIVKAHDPELLSPDDSQEKPHKTKGKLIIGILVALVVLIGGAAAAYTFLVQPEMKEENAERVTNVSVLLDSAAPSIGKEFKSMTLQGYIDTGDSYYDKWNYSKAMKYYERAQDIEKSDALTSKIYDCKYGYVVANQENGGDTFERYLEELMAIGYGGVEEIYNKYYKWHYKIVANRSADDFSTSESTFSRMDTIYMHVTLSGGKPDETKNIYYEVTWPSGRSQVGSLGEGLKDGSQVTARFQYAIPHHGREGTFVFKLFDESTNKVLKTKTVEFVQ